MKMYCFFTIPTDVDSVECFIYKDKFWYSAVSNNQECSKGFTLYFPDTPVQSDITSTSLGSVQPHSKINARRLLLHMSTTRSLVLMMNILEVIGLRLFRQLSWCLWGMSGDCVWWMLGCGLQRLSADGYVYSKLGIWLCIPLDRDDYLFPTAL